MVLESVLKGNYLVKKSWRQEKGVEAPERSTPG